MMTMASNILENSFKNYDKSLLASDLPRAICLETHWTPGAVAVCGIGESMAIACGCGFYMGCQRYAPTFLNTWPEMDLVGL
jgi:hypothetical protein